MALICGVYGIVHRPSGRMYVGSSVDIRKRWASHKCKLNGGTSQTPKLQHSWSKRGPLEFEFKLLLICDRADLIFYEQRAFDTLLPFYNSNPVAERLTWTPEMRERFLESMRRPEHRQRMAVFPKGKKASAATRKKMSETRKGRPWTAVQRAACERWRRDPVSLARRSVSHVGKKHSVAARQKISVAYRRRRKSWVVRRPRAVV